MMKFIGPNNDIEVLCENGLNRVVKFERSDGKGYWYRSETVAGPLLVGTTYSTKEEAVRNFNDMCKEDV